MAISLQQVHKQTQQLIMTPQMQQSIQLLQMNTLELEQLVQQELSENPFLKQDDDSDDAVSENGVDTLVERAGDTEEKADAALSEDFLAPVEKEVLGEPDAGAEQSFENEPSFENESSFDGMEPFDSNGLMNGSAQKETLPEVSDEVRETDPSVDSLSLEDRPEHFDEVDLNWDDYYDDAENKSYMTEDEEEQRDFSEYTAAKVSLYEHLMWQLRLCSLEGTAYDAGEYLLGCLDENGYLDPSCLNDICEKFAIDMKEAERILSIIQELEPIGIGSRSSSECLLIQMKALGSYSDLARQILENHFDEFQRKKFKSIAKSLSVSEDDIVDVCHKVARLEPRPGRAYSIDSAQYIEPDVVVKIIDGKLSIFLNEGSGSRLSINRFYRQMLRLQAKALTKEEKNYATEKFRGALMLLKNIEKRKSTILRVTEAIMDVQREFLDKGVEALKPLTLREVADMVGMHESTIARVTARKYVETPQGVYSLKYFFSSSIESSDGQGEAVSSRAIKDKMSDLIAKENPKNPLSDQKIAEILKKDGYQIARRTVAKYRDQIKILPAKLRRQT